MPPDHHHNDLDPTSLAMLGDDLLGLILDASGVTCPPLPSEPCDMEETGRRFGLRFLKQANGVAAATSGNRRDKARLACKWLKKVFDERNVALEVQGAELPADPDELPSSSPPSSIRDGSSGNGGDDDEGMMRRTPDPRLKERVLRMVQSTPRLASLQLLVLMEPMEPPWARIEEQVLVVSVVELLSAMRDPSNLRVLHAPCCPLPDFASLSACVGLTDLSISHRGEYLTDPYLTPLATSCRQLLRLAIGGNQELEDLSPLTALGGSLEDLDVNDCPRLQSLAPLSSLTRLKTLDFPGCSVSELTPLSGLTSLRRLVLSQTAVEELGSLSGLVGLEELELEDCTVTDLTPLSTCQGLGILRMDSTNVTSLDPLRACLALEWLEMPSCHDVSALVPLTGLRWLDVQSCSDVSSLEPLALCIHLEVLRIGETRVSDLAPLAACRRLKSLTANCFRNLTPLSSLSSLESLDVSTSGVADPTPLSGLIRLSVLDLTDTLVRDLEPLRGCRALESLFIKGSPLETGRGLEALKDSCNKLVELDGECFCWEDY